jgi:hypothetical protein
MTKLTRQAIKLLRAMLGGPMEPEQFTARFGFCSPTLGSLVKAGLVERHGNRSGWDIHYQITDAGRAALPPRNPAAATRRLQPLAMGENVRSPGHQRQGNRCHTTTHA